MVQMVRRPWYGKTYLSSRSWAGMRRGGGMEPVRWMEIGTLPDVLMFEVGNEVTGELVSSMTKDGVATLDDEVWEISSLSLS
jgi:hypothetical protein